MLQRGDWRHYGGRFDRGRAGSVREVLALLISPIVAAVVVTSIGFSLLSVGAASFGGGSGSPDFGSPQNIALGSHRSHLVLGIPDYGKR